MRLYHTWNEGDSGELAGLDNFLGAEYSEVGTKFPSPFAESSIGPNRAEIVMTAEFS